MQGALHTFFTHNPTKLIRCHLTICKLGNLVLRGLTKAPQQICVEAGPVPWPQSLCTPHPTPPPPLSLNFLAVYNELGN